MEELPQAHSLPLSPVCRAKPIRRCSSASVTSPRGKERPDCQESMKKILQDLRTQFNSTRHRTKVPDDQADIKEESSLLPTVRRSPRLVSPVRVKSPLPSKSNGSQPMQPMEVDNIKEEPVDYQGENKDCINGELANKPLSPPVKSEFTEHNEVTVKSEDGVVNGTVSGPKAGSGEDSKPKRARRPTRKVNGKLLASILKDIPSIGVSPSNKRKVLTGGMALGMRRRQNRSESTSAKEGTDYYRSLLSWEADMARGSKARCAPVLFALKHIGKELKQSDDPWMKKAKLIWTTWKRGATPAQKAQFVKKAKQNRSKYHLQSVKPGPAVKKEKPSKAKPRTTLPKKKVSKASPPTSEVSSTSVAKTKVAKKPKLSAKNGRPMTETSKPVVASVSRVSALTPATVRPSCSVVTVGSQRPLSSVKLVSSKQTSFPAARKSAVHKKNALSSEINLLHNSPAFSIPQLPAFGKAPNRPATLSCAKSKQPLKSRGFGSATRHNKIRSTSLTSSGGSCSMSPFTPTEFSLSPKSTTPFPATPTKSLPVTPKTPFPATPNLVSPLAANALIAQPPFISGAGPRSPNPVEKAIKESIRQLKLSTMSLWELKQLYNQHKIELFKRRSIAKFIKAQIVAVEQQQSTAQLTPNDLHKRFLHFLVTPKDTSLADDLRPFGRNCDLECFESNFDTPVLKKEFDVYDAFASIRADEQLKQ